MIFFFRLISTDALARGIDISDCDYVISYDPPRNIKTYIHRIGRTGRAGRKGSAVTMLLHNQVRSFKVCHFKKGSIFNTHCARLYIYI